MSPPEHAPLPPRAKARLRVFLADDHPIFRSGLRGHVSAEPDMEVVGEAADGEAALRGVLELQPDVAVLDVSMPGLGGAEVAARIRRGCPDVKIVALSAHEDRGYVQQMLAAGAAGSVIKRSAAEDLVRAIRCAVAGMTYLDPAVAGPLVAAHALAGQPAAAPALSDRETEVLKQVALGHPIKQIAVDLDLGIRTVETYKARAMEKLGLRTRSEVLRYAVQRGWLAGG